MIMNDLREEDETAKDVAGYPKLIKRVREQFTDSTEELARKAILKGELTVGDFADGILEFYEALPRGFFDNVGQKGSKHSQSSDEPSVKPAKPKVAPKAKN